MSVRGAALLGLLSAVAVVAGLWAAKPAEAAFPGQNGKLLFTNCPEEDCPIYTMNPDGSERTEIGYGSQPAFSADGGKIVFTHQYEIYVMNPDGSGEEQVTSGAYDYSPAFSPDGEKIAFERQGDVYVANSDGSEPTNLTGSPTVTDGGPAWSPDGGKIAFHSYRGGSGESKDFEIYVMNPDGSGQTNLTDTPEYDDRGPSWSPDGEKIAFERQGDVYVVSPDGSGQTNLTNDPEKLDGSPSFSPDGTRIAFVKTVPCSYNGRDCQYPKEDRDIYVMDADGSESTNLTDDMSYYGGLDWGPLTTNTAPQVARVRPAPDGMTRDRTPLIRALVRDAQTDLAEADIRLYVDGRRVTAFRYDQVTDRLEYASGRLSYGRHTVKVVATDAQGLVATKRWGFRVDR